MRQRTLGYDKSKGTLTLASQTEIVKKKRVNRDIVELFYYKMYN